MEDFNKTLVIYSHFWWFQNPNLPFYHNTLLYGMWSSMKMPLNISPENKVSYLCRVFLCLSWMMKDLWKKNPEKFLSRNVNVVVIVFSKKKHGLNIRDLLRISILTRGGTRHTTTEQRGNEIWFFYNKELGFNTTNNDLIMRVKHRRH